MSTDLLRQAPHRVVGAKQTLKKVTEGRATAVFVADDADPGVIRAIVDAARAQKIPIHSVATMAELGQACGIQVGAAAAALVASVSARGAARPRD
jgi:large subunit ribosomal protein L7A